MTPVALVFSNLPIVAETIRRALRGRYEVVARPWSGWNEAPPGEADLVVADVTLELDVPPIHALAAALESRRVVVFSLHRNEVEDYHLEENGLRRAVDLPTLMAL